MRRRVMLPLLLAPVVGGLACALAYLGTPAPPAGLDMDRRDLVGPLRVAWAAGWLVAAPALFVWVRRRGTGRVLAVIPLVGALLWASTAAAHVDCQPNVATRLVLPFPAGMDTAGPVASSTGEGPMLDDRLWSVRREGASLDALLDELVAHYRARGWQIERDGTRQYRAYHHPYVLWITPYSSDRWTGREPEVGVRFGVHRSGLLCFR